jgi:anti-sigma regulatory factor (Ser/Thr protein kinase)
MQIQLRVPQDRELLPSLFAAIDDVLARAGIAHALAHDVRLVSEEVVCNAIEHGQQPDSEYEITLEIAIHDDRVTLCFRDDGEPFDPLSQPPPDLEADIGERPIGGLGVHLVRTLADEIAYTRDADRNVLRVVLRRSP